MRKVKQIDGEPTIVTVPKFYTVGNKTYVGDFDKLDSNIHEKAGFFKLVEPDYNPRIEKKGSLIWDETNRVFTYQVERKNFDLETLKESHRREVLAVIREVSQITSDVKNIYDPLRETPGNIPQDFKKLVKKVQPLRQRARNEIDSLSTVQEALDYIVRGPEVKGYIEQLKSFL